VKRIVYIHQYFNKPEQGGSLRSYYLATALAKQNFDVQLITSHNHKQKITETFEGVQIHYLPVFYDYSLGFYSRIKAFIWFTIRSLSLALKLKPDLIFATSTPLTIGLVPLIISYFKKTPYIFEVRDLWPKAPIEMGYLRNPFLIKIACILEKLIYKNSTGIIALSPGMQTHVQELVPQKQIICIPNMADAEYFKPNFERKYTKDSTLTISYIGSSGPVNELHNLIHFAEYLHLHHYNNIKIIVASKGKELSAIKAKCTKLNLNNIDFINYQNRLGVKELLANSDFTYITFKDIPALRIASPNKLFDSLAAGIPIISAINGWWVSELKNYQCGLVYNPQEPAELHKALVPFIENINLLHQFKQNAYFLAKSKYSKKIQIENFITYIKEFI